MAKEGYVLDARSIAAIRRTISKVRKEPPRPLTGSATRRTAKADDVFWALPPCETGLPAAKYINGRLVSDGVYCCLFRNNRETSEIEPVIDGAGLPVRVPVYNYYLESENGLVQVVQHRDASWSNIRPRDVSEVNQNNPVGGGTGITPAPPLDCDGECVWVADANLAWQWPTGGCTEASTTSTSSTSSTSSTPAPGSTAPPWFPPLNTTKPPCFLVCEDTGTTPAPGDYGIPTPYTRYRYVLKPDSTPCDTGFKCYGLGDPCFFEGGEIESDCIVDVDATTTSTSTTTTYAPDVSPCFIAETLFGAAEEGFERWAIRPGEGNVWEQCSACNGGQIPFYPLGGDLYKDYPEKNQVTIYDSPCVANPCDVARAIPGTRPYFAAFDYDQQRSRWGDQPFVEFDGLRNAFRANWVLCRECGEAERPVHAPPAWLDIDPAQNRNASYGLSTRTYTYVAECEDGLPCDTCSRAPRVGLRESDPVYDTPTTTLAPTTLPPGETTPAPTTTPRCGCVRPTFCATEVGECYKTRCTRGGEIVGGTPAPTTTPSGSTTTFAPDALLCFLDKPTTTASPTTSTSTTPLPIPDACYDSSGTLCDCLVSSSTTTSLPLGTIPPGGGAPACPEGSAPIYSVDLCSWYCVPIPPPGGPPGEIPPVPCRGVCIWQARGVGVDSNGIPVIGWTRYGGGCSSGIFADGIRDVDCSCGRVCCNCPPPAIPADVCYAFTTTGCSCDEGSGGTTPSPTTRPPQACDCCTSTTPNPCVIGTCVYRGDGAGGWIKTDDTCNPGCPCPPASAIPGESQDSCDRLELECDPDLPPTTTPIPPTTTQGPKRCCSAYGECFLVYGDDECENYLTGPTSDIPAIPAPDQEDCNSCLGACCELANPPDGWNCYQDGRIQCEAIGGVWYGTATRCEDIVCGSTTSTSAPLGSCCVQDQLSDEFQFCMDGVTQSGCDIYFGSFSSAQTCAQRAGTLGCAPTTTSSTSTTASPFGACCYESGCGFLRRNLCELNGGTFLGEGIECDGPDGSPCAGACCLPNGMGGFNCSNNVFPGNCAGGIFKGLGTDCLTSPCVTTTTSTTTTSTTTPVPTGACCIGAICFNGYTAAACLSEGGVYQGNGSNCSVPSPILCEEV